MVQNVCVFGGVEGVDTVFMACQICHSTQKEEAQVVDTVGRVSLTIHNVCFKSCSTVSEYVQRRRQVMIRSVIVVSAFSKQSYYRAE